MENFDERALTWDNEPRRIERATVVAAAIIKAIPNLDQMIGFEYGCGTGLLSFELRSHLKRIILGDNSQGMLDVVKQKIKTTECTNLTPLWIDLANGGEIPNQKFDILYTMLTLHHIPDTDQIIASFAQLLSSFGYLCIVDLDEEDGSFHGEGFLGHHGFNRFKLAQILIKFGFEDIRCTTCYHNPKQRADGTIRTYPLFLMTAIKSLRPEGIVPNR